LLLCISTRRVTLAAFTQGPPNEKHRKVTQRERAPREDNEILARFVGIFHKAGDGTQNTAGM
jgi:hypothetical protein